MSPLFAFLLVVAGVVAVLLLARRDLEVFRLVVERGHVTRARGRMPHEMSRDLHDVLERAKATGTVVGRVEDHRVVVHVSGGIDDATAQRLRNVVGRFRAAQIRQGKRIG